jgi:hypothetical protein
MSVRYARSQAEKLVERLGMMHDAPIDVKAIAQALHLKVIEANLGPGVSGLLVSDGLNAQVCVQKGNTTQRKRFTVAHEIGHHLLGHQFESGEHVLVDRGYYISERGARASAGVDPKEIEANRFAAALLMPSKMVRAEVSTLGGVPLLDSAVTDLASIFDVSEQAMTIRLKELDLL